MAPVECLPACSSGAANFWTSKALNLSLLRHEATDHAFSCRSVRIFQISRHSTVLLHQRLHFTGRGFSTCYEGHANVCKLGCMLVHSILLGVMNSKNENWLRKILPGMVVPDLKVVQMELNTEELKSYCCCVLLSYQAWIWLLQKFHRCKNEAPPLVLHEKPEVLVFDGFIKTIPKTPSTLLLQRAFQSILAMVLPHPNLVLIHCASSIALSDQTISLPDDKRMGL